MGEVLTSTVCAVCGSRYLSNLKVCPQCGSVEITDGAIAPGGKAVAWVDSFPIGIKNCPVCSSATVRKVGEIYRQAGAIGPDVELARRLAPPARPSGYGRMLAIVPVSAAIGSALFAFILSVVISAEVLAPYKGQALPGWDIVLCCCLGLVGMYTGGTLARRRIAKRIAELEQNNHEELDRWIGEMEVWERLYYCPVCDKISDPLVGRSAHVHAMGNLLDG